MVHRRAAAEVFLTGAHQISQREWAFDVQISRGHVLVPPHTSEIPLTLCIEALRQMGLYMAHSGYAIPTDWAFTLQKTTFAWLPDARVAFPEFGPLELTTHLVVTGETLRKGTVSGLEASLEFYVGTEKVAVGTGELRCISPVHYRALRRGAPAPTTWCDGTTRPRCESSERPPTATWGSSATTTPTPSSSTIPSTTSPGCSSCTP